MLSKLVMQTARLNYSDAKPFKAKTIATRRQNFITTKGDVQMVQHDHCRELLEEIFNVCENYSCENIAICAQELANITLWFGDKTTV